MTRSEQPIRSQCESVDRSRARQAPRQSIAMELARGSECEGVNHPRRSERERIVDEAPAEVFPGEAKNFKLRR